MEKICAYCGKRYQPKSNNSKYCHGPHYATCPICGKTFEIKNDYYLSHPVKSCSSYECRKKAREKTSLERYGIKAPGNNPEARRKSSETMIKKYGVPYAQMSDDIREKSKKTLIEKYGVDNASKNEDVKRKRHKTVMEKFNGKYPFNSDESFGKHKRTMMERYGAECSFRSPQLRDKAKQTMIEKYGVDVSFKSKELQEKRRKTLLERYGCENPFSSSTIRDKAEQTNIRKYGVYNVMKSEKFIKKSLNSKLKRYGCYRSEQSKQKYIYTMKERYGVPYGCLLPSAQRKLTISKTNKDFLKFLQSNGFDVSENNMEFKIGRRSYDFILPNNILIEINPTYTHNSHHNRFHENGIPANYHKFKTQLAKDHGFRCINIWDWDDWNKILTLIQPTKQIMARKCDIYILKNKSTVDSFLNENHIQGTARNQLLCFGLVFKGELVQIMTFGNARYNKNYDTELIRLCTKKGYKVVGGASKMMSYACRYFSLGKVISYCDLSKFTGDVYKRIGMTHVRDNKPAKIWSKKNRYVSSSMLLNLGYDKIFKTNYGTGTSNEELMIQNGWLPVYDCGQAVYELDAGF